MISKGRIVRIFITRGGANFTIDKLSRSQKDFLEQRLEGDESLIAQIQSAENWFAVTASQVVTSKQGRVRNARLSDIKGIVPRPMSRLVENKRSGGTVELRLTDGSVLPLKVEGGKLFMATLNVFMYVVKMNQGGGYVAIVR
jgi:hypothetical protein